MQMHLSHWLRVLWRWAYDRDFHGLPALWFETLWWIKPRYASSYRVRHNRFPSLKLLVTLFKTIGYARSVSVTGNLRSNDDIYKYAKLKLWVSVTGNLRSNDDQFPMLPGCSTVSVTGNLRSNDDLRASWINAIPVSVTGSLHSNNDDDFATLYKQFVSVTGSLCSNNDKAIESRSSEVCFSYW